ncbi:MAG TPA: hypothetical protein DCS17_07530 [Flavobacterium sp.]|nr:hypothetical protein [Flavobacterium sp.]
MDKKTQTPETYTLQRFYYEVKAVLEQYPEVKKIMENANERLEVRFDIEDTVFDSKPRLSCVIYFSGGRGMATIFITSPTPVAAINELIEKCKQLTGQQMIEKVGIENPQN